MRFKLECSYKDKKNYRKFTFLVCKILNIDDAGVEGKGLFFSFSGHFQFGLTSLSCPVVPFPSLRHE